MEFDEIAKLATATQLRAGITKQHVEVFGARTAGEKFTCELTYGRSPGGMRWTLIAIGEDKYRRGIMLTGRTAIVSVPMRDITKAVETDARAALTSAVAVHGKDWQDK